MPTGRVRKMFVAATGMFLAVVVALEWGLVKFLRDEFFYERRRKGFRNRRLHRVGLVCWGIASVGLAVVGLFLIRAIIVLSWTTPMPTLGH